MWIGRSGIGVFKVINVASFGMSDRKFLSSAVTSLLDPNSIDQSTVTVSSSEDYTREERVYLDPRFVRWQSVAENGHFRGHEKGCRSS
jgi:hypothetical protein